MLDIPRKPTIIAALEAVRARYHTPIAPFVGPELLSSEFGQFLVDCVHAVRAAAQQLPADDPHRAWLLRAGLLLKPGGTRCLLPDARTTVSIDSLTFPTVDAEHVDILGDGEGAAVIGWGDAHVTDGSRYIDVSHFPPSDGDAPIPSPPVPQPPAPPVPAPPASQGPAHSYDDQLALAHEIGAILDVPDSPYYETGISIGEVIGHLLWRYQFEGYARITLLEDARNRAEG